MRLSSILLLPLCLAALLFTSCHPSAPEATVLRVGASPVPHEAILENIKPLLAKQGITLQIVEMTDYAQPNVALLSGELDANFFQHQPYLDQFNREHNAKLVSVVKVHVEPLGVYSKRIHGLGELKTGATVAIPNDPANGARALWLLEFAGLLKLKPSDGLVTAQDIIDNPHKLEIKERESAQLPNALSDVDIAVINTNYALAAGLNPERDVLVREGRESRYANVVAVRPDRVEDVRIQALVRAITSAESRHFIEANFRGAVVPLF